MGRTRLERSIIAELEAKIKEIEGYKKKLLTHIHHIKDKCLNREITFSDYESHLKEKRNGKTLHEWLEHYEEYIDKCKKRIKKLENKAKRKKVYFIFLSFVVLSVIIFSIFYLRPIIVGLATQEQTQSLVQQVNLEFNDSLEYEWSPEYPGRLQAFKISGLIEGEGSVRLYLNDILVLDSSDLNNSYSENSEGLEIGTSKLTGLAVEEALQTEESSPSQEEPLYSEQSEEPAFPSENTTEPAEIIENKSALPEENRSVEENITLPETLEEVFVKEFKEYCKDTCSLDLNKANYTLKIEISDAKLNLQKINYEILTAEAIEIPENISEVNITLPETNITNETTIQYKAVIGKPVKWIKTIELEQPGRVKIKLPKEAENISVNKIIGESYSVEEEALASPSQEKQEPLLSSGTEPAEITENKTTLLEENITALENITETEAKEKAGFSITTNAIAAEETPTGIFSYILVFFRNFLSIMTGRAVATEQPEEIELIIEDNATGYEIEYYTEAPQAFEQETGKGKTIIISARDELNYTDVLAYTELPFEVSPGVVRLYHLTETGREEENITEYDLNENNLTDYIEWNVEHLSNQTYELEIIIINVKSQPQVGKNWTVMFNTTGKANLTITAFNGTNWSDSNEKRDLRFLEIRCEDEILEYEWIENADSSSVFIPDYECNETAKEVSKVLTTGIHTLEFDFGGTKAYAYNTAGVLNLFIFGSTSYYYNSSVKLMTVQEASTGYDLSLDGESSPTTPNYSEFYSNITSGAEYHLVIDAWNDTILPRTFYLIYSFDSTAGAQTGTLNFYWNNITDTNYTGNFTYYADNNTYQNSVASVDMRTDNSYSASITSKQKLYVKVNILGYIFPIINITYPANTTYTTSPASLNYTINASNPGKCWWSNSSGVWNSTPVACGINWSATAVQGSNTWTVYANDTAGSLNSSSVTFIFSSPRPGINFTAPTPANGTYTLNASVEANVSIIESNLNEVKWGWNGTNYSFYNDSLMVFFNFENLSTLGESVTRVADLSKYSNNGTCIAAQCPTLMSGKYGNSYYFNNKNMTITRNADLDFATASFSYSIWMNSTAGATSEIVCKQSGTATSTTAGFRTVISSASATGISAVIGNGTNNSRLDTGTTTACWNSSLWCMLTVVVDRSNRNMSIYLNGMIVKSMGIGTGSIANSYDIRLGNVVDGTASRFFTGRLDDFMMFNRTLSSSEISELYMSSLQKYNSTQWYFYVNQSKNATARLDNGTYTYFVSAKDASGNENSTETRTIIIGEAPSAGDNLPSVTLNSPANYQNLSSVSVTFNCTALDDINLTNVTLYGNWSSGWHANETNSSGINGTNYLFAKTLSDGSYIWNCRACDNATNCSFAPANFTFTIDTSFPQINFTSPTPASGTSTTNTSIEINVSITESSLGELKYNWNGTNYTFYNDSLRIYFNFDNVSALDETYVQNTIVYDLSQYHNNGNLTNTSSITRSWAPTWISGGKYGGAFNFTAAAVRDTASNDNGSSILIPHSDSLNPYSSNFAMMYWLRCDATLLDCDLSRKGSTGTSPGNVMYKMEIGGYSVNNLLSLQFNGATAATLEYENGVCDGIWHFVVGQRVGDTAELWIDGYNTTASDWTGSGNDNTLSGSISNNANLTIGSKDTQDDDHCRVILDEYRIYINRSFSQDEINNLYFSNLNKYDADKWTFYVNQSKNATTGLDDGTYTYFASAKDASGNANSTEQRTITIGAAANNAAQVTWVQPISNVNPAEGTTRTVHFNVTMYDADGVDDLNDTSVNATFSKATATDEANRTSGASGTCTLESEISALKTANYSCAIDMWHWDSNGTWNISVQGKDLGNGTWATNTTTNFTYQRLRALALSPEVFTFNLTIGAINITSNENMTINNTGNYNMSGKVLVNAINLYSGSYYIDVGNFSASVLGGVLSCNITANTLINGTNVTITSSVLERGNLSTGQANETLYYCAKEVPINIPSGVYDTRVAGSWAIVVEIALFVYAPRVNTKQKKKKKRIEKEPLVKALNLITKELQIEYTKEKQEAAALLISEIKKKYNLNSREILKLIETRKEIPVTIFSRKLGALEAVVKYLKENLNLSYIEIARMLCRDERTIWTAYSKAKQKQPSALTIGKTETFLPSSIFNEELTILESAILHLKEKGLRFNEIASLLDRDQRNIWLIYSRAVKKQKRKV